MYSYLDCYLEEDIQLEVWWIMAYLAEDNEDLENQGSKLGEVKKKVVMMVLELVRVIEVQIDSEDLLIPDNSWEV